MFKIVLNMFFVSALSALSAQAMISEQVEATTQSSSIKEQQAQNFAKLVQDKVKQIQAIENDLIEDIAKDISYNPTNPPRYYRINLDRLINVCKDILHNDKNVVILDIKGLSDRPGGKHQKNDLLAATFSNIFYRAKLADMQMQNILNQLLAQTEDDDRAIFDLFDQHSKFYYFIGKKLYTASSVILHIIKYVILSKTQFFNLCLLNNAITRTEHNRWFSIFDQHLLKVPDSNHIDNDAFKNFLKEVDSDTLKSIAKGPLSYD